MSLQVENGMQETMFREESSACLERVGEAGDRGRGLTWAEEGRRGAYLREGE